MFAEKRQEKIAEILKEKSSIKVSKLSNIFNVSESTIRRDLQDMEQNGLLTRTHGGAIPVKKTNFEPTFEEKEDRKHYEKADIGGGATSLIENNDTIILDSGTTTLEIAKNIKAKNVTVITNSLDIALELSNKEDIELIIAGGTLRKVTRAMVGYLTEATLRNFRVDKAFIGANGISVEEGITTPNFTEAQSKKAMMNVANKVFVVADSSKFNEVSFSVISPIRAVTAIITNIDLDKAVIKDFQEAGVEIITAIDKEYLQA